MRKALIVGINYYQTGGHLNGCVNDANNVRNIIERNGDRSVNFGAPKLLTASNHSTAITKQALKDAIEELFRGQSDIALFYFAGHGHIESSGGYILASDATRGDDGVPLSTILNYANQSAARNKIIVLDSCHSGIAGNPPNHPAHAQLTEGTTILTAPSADQYATERNNSGVFTTLFVNALDGAACNLLGDVSPGSAYAHIDQSLGAWDQRPIFKTNVRNFVSLRKVQPPIDLVDLRRITEFFPNIGHVFPLDPSFEPSDEGRTPQMRPADPGNNAIFAILQKYRDVGLLRPLNAPNMWEAAMRSKSCNLTVLGEHYRQLVQKGLI